MVRARFLMLTDVYDRAVTGEKMDEKKYDFKVIPEITEKCCKEYDLWPAGAIAKSSIVPESNDQADRLYRAGWDLLVECGQYNIDTNRRVKIADDEVREGLKRCPKELWLGGPGGKDAAHMIPRKVDGVNYEVKPLTQGGPTGAPITEPVFIKLMQSYAQEACVDTIVDGVLNTIEGVPGLPETPREVKAVMSEVTWIRIACMEAGRSGMAIQGPESALGKARLAADFGSPAFYGICGLRPQDSHEISQLNELKFDTDALNIIQHSIMCGNVVMIEQMPILGGYVGTVEQCAITDVATHLSSFCMFNASYHLDGPIHVRWGITTARETAQVAGHAAVALDRNTGFLLANQYYTLAGPMTEMCLLETACQAVTDACSGREMKSGVAAAKGVAADKTTGMEARVMAEASMGGCKINRAKANEVLNAILAKYEADYKVAPAGVTFQECYDPISIKPTDEYLAVYEKAMGTLEDCGLPLKGIY